MSYGGNPAKTPTMRALRSPETALRNATSGRRANIWPRAASGQAAAAARKAITSPASFDHLVGAGKQGW
jgi:hypothetical protein